MATVEDRVREKISGFGVQVVDVRIVRMELPDANQKSIFSRMRSDREKEAKELRAIGFEESEFIKSLANKDANVIIADAYAKRGKIIGDAIFASNSMYEKSAAFDPEFFSYYSKNIAYRNSMKEDNKKTIFMSSKNDFISTMHSGK